MAGVAIILLVIVALCLAVFASDLGSERDEWRDSSIAKGELYLAQRSRADGLEKRLDALTGIRDQVAAWLNNDGELRVFADKVSVSCDNVSVQEDTHGWVVLINGKPTRNVEAARFLFTKQQSEVSLSFPQHEILTTIMRLDAEPVEKESVA